MAGRSWKQGAREELTDELKALLANALDDVRHKVIEQAWSGQEQTGYLLSPYGSHQEGDQQQPQVNIYNTIHNHEASTDAEQQKTEPYVHVPAGDWTEGEDYRGGYGSGNDDRRPRNGWEIGQDPTQPTHQEQERERQEEQERQQGM